MRLSKILYDSYLSHNFSTLAIYQAARSKFTKICSSMGITAFFKDFFELYLGWRRQAYAYSVYAKSLDFRSGVNASFRVILRSCAELKGRARSTPSSPSAPFPVGREEGPRARLRDNPAYAYPGLPTRQASAGRLACTSRGENIKE